MIINLTQHPATPEQKDAGVTDLEGIALQAVKDMLTFRNIPDQDEIRSRCAALVVSATMTGAKKAMIGGAPFLMTALERALKHNGIQPLYAFSQREVIEQQTENGEVVKKAIFKHLGFVES